jgi:hypothetical protein
MTLRRALTLATAALPLLAAAMLLLAPLARSGHELPVYPSYYPHEIEIGVLEPQEAGDLLGKGKLHAYVGGAAGFGGALPKDIASAPSLGSWLVVRLNPNSEFAKGDESACSVVSAVVRELEGKGGDVVAHPYPVTPLHGDYLHHIDLAEAAKARLGGAAASDLKLLAEGVLAQGLVRPKWRAEGADWDAVIQEIDARRLVASSTTLVNGWIGPRWVRSGWFHAYRLLAETITDADARQRVDAGSRPAARCALGTHAECRGQSPRSAARSTGSRSSPALRRDAAARAAATNFRRSRA